MLSNLVQLIGKVLFMNNTFKEGVSRGASELPLNHNIFFLPCCIIHDCQLFQNSFLSLTACAFLDYSVHLGELTGRSI